MPSKKDIALRERDEALARAAAADKVVAEAQQQLELAQAMEDSVGASRNPSMQRRTQSGMLDREMLALAKTSQRAAREESVDVLP